MKAGTVAGGQTFTGQKDKMVDDIKAVMSDAQDMLDKARSSSVEGYSAVRTELEDRLSDSIVRLQEVQEELKARARSAARATDTYVRDNPWKSIGYVAAAGLVIGLLISRGR